MSGFSSPLFSLFMRVSETEDLLGDMGFQNGAMRCQGRLRNGR